MRIISTVFLIALIYAAAAGQARPISEQLADTAMSRLWVDSQNGKGVPDRWNYEQGVVLSGMKDLWYSTADRRYYDYLKKGVDAFVNADGTIKTYSRDQFSLDLVKMGTAVMAMYRATGDQKYKKAADLLRSQLKDQPRTNEGGFWHKKIYPYQMLSLIHISEPTRH